MKGEKLSDYEWGHLIHAPASHLVFVFGVAKRGYRKETSRLISWTGGDHTDCAVELTTIYSCLGDESTTY